MQKKIVYSVLFMAVMGMVCTAFVAIKPDMLCEIVIKQYEVL